MENKYDKLKLKNQLCFPIYLCSKELVRKYNNVLKEYDLTYTQYIVMLYLWEINEVNVSTLGSAMLLDSSTLTPLLEKMENKGYIIRERLQKDERNLIIKLTKKGIILKDKVINVPDKIKDRMKTRIVLIKSYNLAKKPCLYPLITATINTNKIQNSTI